MSDQPSLPARRDRITGMLLMALAMLIVPGLDAIAKLLMERLPPLQVTFGRFLIQTFVLLPQPTLTCFNLLKKKNFVKIYITD